MTLKMNVAHLQGVPETLLITLYGRAIETHRTDAIIRDQRAVRLLEAIDYDFDRFHISWTTQLNTAIRTQIFDELATQFLCDHPDATIVNLGAGLDARFERLDNQRMHWFDLDLPETIATRRRFFSETERNSCIACSLLDTAWMERIDTQTPLLLLAEGVLPYFEEDDIRLLLARLADRFAGAEIVFDTVSPFVARRSNNHAALKRTDSIAPDTLPLRWGISDAQSIADWDDRFELLGQWFTLDRNRARWRELGWLGRIPAFKRLISGPIVHLRLGR